MNPAKLALALCLSVCASAAGQTAGMPAHSPADLDRDGIDDAVEQSLLERFLPHFMVSTGDCDVAPSLFLQGALDPVALVQDGTIYGQCRRAVTPRAIPAALYGKHRRLRCSPVAVPPGSTRSGCLGAGRNDLWTGLCQIDLGGWAEGRAGRVALLS